MKIHGPSHNDAPSDETSRQMIKSLIQFTLDGAPGVAALDEHGKARRLSDVSSVIDLAGLALRDGLSLSAAAGARAAEGVDLSAVTLQAPIDHADPAHILLSGTGLTHLGSVEGRDKMHKQAVPESAQTDSMRLFQMGLKGGKPPAGEVGVQPEWFYKGDGSSIVASGEPLSMPSFSLDGGEEPEIAGVYLIDPAGRPHRLGYVLANEFSDHETERGNYLWLAHSKLRKAALGPELRLGPLPDEVRGVSRIRRGNQIIFEKPFLSGEAHHFKYPAFRRPGDVHVHFFGTACLSFTDGIKAVPGDIFEIEADAFTLPLSNALAVEHEAPLDIGAL
jgi:hypothetical protein